MVRRIRCAKPMNCLTDKPTMKLPRRTILVVGMGTSPAVLTETVWELAHLAEPVLPDEVSVIATKSGRDMALSTLLSGENGVWRRLLSALRPSRPCVICFCANTVDIQLRIFKQTIGDNLLVFIELPADCEETRMQMRRLDRVREGTISDSSRRRPGLRTWRTGERSCCRIRNCEELRGLSGHWGNSNEKWYLLRARNKR